MEARLMQDLERAVENNQTMMATTLLLNAIKDLDARLEKCTCGEKKTTAKKTKTSAADDDKDK